MKFKKQGGIRRLAARDEALIIETREDGKPGLFIMCDGTFLTRGKALKLAWAIIEELSDPEVG